MPYEQRDNSGGLFENDRKRPDKNDSDYTGTVMVGGVLYWCNLWKKKTGAGKTWLSLSFKAKQDNGAGQPPAAASQPTQPSGDGW